MLISKSTKNNPIRHRQMIEIGFVNMYAAILGNGLLSGKVTPSAVYDQEKLHVNTLLLAWVETENLSLGTKSVLRRLIIDALDKWWSDSRYGIQLYAT